VRDANDNPTCEEGLLNEMLRALGRVTMSGCRLYTAEVYSIL